MRSRRRAATAAVVTLAVIWLLGHGAAKGVLAGTGTGSAGNVAASSPGVAAEYAYAAQVFHDGPVQQGCLHLLWNHESGWSAWVVNPHGGAYGIPQALPAAQGHPYAIGDWQAQIRWGRRYIVGRYGTPCAAWQHEINNNWY